MRSRPTAQQRLQSFHKPCMSQFARNVNVNTQTTVKKKDNSSEKVLKGVWQKEKRSFEVRYSGGGKMVKRVSKTQTIKAKTRGWEEKEQDWAKMAQRWQFPEIKFKSKFSRYRSAAFWLESIFSMLFWFWVSGKSRHCVWRDAKVGCC